MTRGAGNRVAPLTYEGAWDGDRIYLPRHVVVHDDASYMATAKNQGVEPLSPVVRAATLYPAASDVAYTTGGDAQLDELDDADGNDVPSWITQNTVTNRVHLTKPGVYAHHVELSINNPTDYRANVSLLCNTTNLGGRSHAFVPAGEQRVVTLDVTLPYFGGELGGDQVLYLHVDFTYVPGMVGGGASSAHVYGSGNSIWAISRISPRELVPNQPWLPLGL